MRKIIFWIINYSGYMKCIQWSAFAPVEDMKAERTLKKINFRNDIIGSLSPCRSLQFIFSSTHTRNHFGLILALIGNLIGVLNLSENGNYNPNLVWINKIPIRFLSVYIMRSWIEIIIRNDTCLSIELCITNKRNFQKKATV